jgi:nucleoside-diphosphate-sugar epimerase
VFLGPLSRQWLPKLFSFEQSLISEIKINMTSPVLLITGGSGLVGSGLVRLLQSDNSNRQIVILTRHPGALLPSPNVAAIRGDLRREGLGLDEPAARTLRASVVEIIHCAADVKFTSSLEQSRQVNTEGTRRLLDFAALCPHLEKMAHISTLFIAGRRPGTVLEQPLHHDCGHFNVYTRCKHETEHIVLDRMRSLPVAIYRLSSIIGNSVTGRVSQTNYFHSLIRLVPRAYDVAAIPGSPETPVDLIADDWAAKALAFLYEHHFVPGRIHHICAGPDRSLKAGELLNMAFRIYNAKRRTALEPPRMLDLSEFKRYGKDSMSWADGPVSHLLSTFLPHLAVHQQFDRGATGKLLDSAGLTLPPSFRLVKAVLQQTLSAQA